MLTLNNMPLRRADFWIVLVASMEQLIGGALATVIAVMLPMIHIVGHPSIPASIQGIIGAMGLIGIGIGSLIIGRLIDKNGYLMLFRLCPILMLVGCAVCYFITSLGGLITGLVLIGIGVGGGYTLDSAYISELMPDKWRQVMVGVAKATCAIGFMGAAVACYFILKHAPEAALWNRMILVVAALALITLLMRLRWAESPKWLQARDQDAKAQKALQLFVGKDVSLDPTEEATGKPQEVKFSIRENWSRIVFSSIPWACEGMGVYGFAVFLPVLVMALGLNFDSASTHGIAKVMGSVEVSAVVNFFMIPGFIIGLFLMPRVNQVKMMTIGFWLSALGLLLLLAAYLLKWPAWVMVVGFLVYEMSLNGGPHLVTFIIPTRVYPVDVRGRGTGIADIVGKAGAVIGVIGMPILLHVGGMALVLGVSIAVMIIGAIVGHIYGRKLGLGAKCEVKNKPIPKEAGDGDGNGIVQQQTQHTQQPQQQPTPKASEEPQHKPSSGYMHFRKYTEGIVHMIVLVLSLLLIVYISYDTFQQIPFLSNHHYMVFQFWVCLVFLADFFIELAFSDNKKTYLKNRWFFFLISIPYLNIINHAQIAIPQDVIYYLRYVPLIRGAYSLSMVMGYISKNRAVSIMAQYVAILAALVYILAMIFYYQEYGVNPNVRSFWDALYWAAMNMTTVGCYFAAVTPVGKVVSVILPILGMLMLPLFTVYVTDKVRRFNASSSQN